MSKYSLSLWKTWANGEEKVKDKAPLALAGTWKFMSVKRLIPETKWVYSDWSGERTIAQIATGKFNPKYEKAKERNDLV